MVMVRFQAGLRLEMRTLGKRPRQMVAAARMMVAHVMAKARPCRFL